MRVALFDWIKMCNDPLDMPEDELVRSRVYPPNGQQPTTEAPTIKLDPVAKGRFMLTITCPTEGASIGYRLKRERGPKASFKPWTIYNGPVEILTEDVIEVEAHRIGFKPSVRFEIHTPQR